MSSKDSTPSPSLGSRFSLDSLRGKQHSTGSISIRFNAASMQDDDDEDDILYQDSSDPSKPKHDPLKIEVKPEPESGNNRANSDVNQSKNGSNNSIESQFRVSRSAPVSEVVTPVSDADKLAATTAFQPVSSGFPSIARNGSKAEPEKSLFSGLKERFQDPIAFIEKLAAESPIIESLDRKFRKQDSLDPPIKPVKPVKSTSGSGLSDKLKESKAAEVCADFKKVHSAGEIKTVKTRHSSVDNEMLCPKFDDDLNVDNCEGNGHSRSNSIDIMEDFFQFPGSNELEQSINSRTLSKFSSTAPPLADKVSQGESHQKQTSPLQKLGIKSKSKGASDRPVAVSLSGLLSNKDDVNGLEDELFFDPSEDQASPKESKPMNLPTQVKSEEPSPSDIAETHKDTNDLYNIPSKHKAVAALVAFLAYLILPLPSYVAGMVFGSVFTAIGIFLYQWWMAPPKPRPHFVLPDLSTLAPLKVPEMKESRNEDGKFKGWMNEINHYDPADYHINLTHSIYVTLEGTTLRIQIPKQGVPKRAMWDESISVTSFVSQRYFDLPGCTVKLLPMGLVKKRLWSKKYPVCLVISKAKSSVDEEIVTDSELKESLEGEEKVDNISPQLVTESNPTSLDGVELDKPTVEAPEVSPDTPDLSEMGFETIGDKPGSNEIRLYLFGRTGREKEEWYRRLLAASQGNPYPTRLSDLAQNADKADSHRGSIDGTRSKSEAKEAFRHKREGSADSNVSESEMKEIYKPTSEQLLTEYLCYMAKIMPGQTKSNPRSKSPSPSGSKDMTSARRETAAPRSVFEKPVPVICEPQALWANALIGRLLWDMLREKYWNDKIMEKIQKKLSKIHVPYFIDELTVTGIDLGAEVPIIRRASQPYLDDRGLWIDLDIAYSGGFYISLETKCNLMKFKKQSKPDAKVSMSKENRSAVTDSDEEDSAESSTDEEAEENAVEVADDRQSMPVGGTSNTSKKILRIVDKIAQSKYFQQATEYKYIKKAMEEVSNLRLILNVELKSLVGTLSVNIPPPPTDRIWYGFRNNPHLWLSAKPRVGQREVNVSHITDWIEKKLAIEFQRVFVMPNMDDLPIPLMCDHLISSPSDPELG